jgi:type IV secretory pathway protease TraF
VQSGLLLNHTASLPEGLYRVARPPAGEAADVARVARGQIVVWCLPRALSDAARARRYLVRGRWPAGGEPLLKFVAALPGGSVDVDTGGLTVNGHLLAKSRAAPLDARGR